MICGKGGFHTILNILDILFKSDTWYVEFPDFKNGYFSSIDYVFSSHMETSITRQCPLVMWQLNQTGKHIPAPQIPQNRHTAPTRAQRPSLQRTECNICFLLAQLTLKQTGPGSLLGPLSHPSALIYKMLCSYSLHLSQARNSVMSVGAQNGELPGIQSRGRDDERIDGEICNLPQGENARHGSGKWSKALFILF